MKKAADAVSAAQIHKVCTCADEVSGSSRKACSRNVNVSGNDVIEEGVMMGSGSTIIQGKKIGQCSTIGAGAVIIENIDSFSTAVGVPARIINVDYIKKGE